jgi:hypothetical protein
MIASRTIYDLVALALRQCGIISLGDSIADPVAQEALLTLNTIRAEWSINTKNYKIFDETYLSTGNAQSITLGTDPINGPGDIAVRPQSIDQVVVISGAPGTSVNYRIDIEPYENYTALARQNVFAIPQKAFIDNSYPVQNIWFYPGLTAGWTVRVQGMSYMTDYENLTDPYIDPPEFFTALYLALALALAPKYGIDLADGAVQQASGAIKHIKAHMLTTRLKQMAPGLKTVSSSFNFYSGMN